MNSLVIYNNPQFGQIRTTGTPETPLFCAADVCRSLGFTNGRKAVADHCEGEDVTKRYTPTSSGMQLMTFINESGLYSLIFCSKLDSAREFKHWVTSEVLPSIRKHGAYATEATIESIIADPDNGIKLLMALRDERRQRQIAEEKIQEQAPKVVFADAVIGSTSSILIGELAKVLKQNGIDMGEKRLFRWMRDNGYLGRTGERRNIPNQRYIEQGLFTLKTNTFSVNGEMRSKATTKVTGKGQQYFINKFLGH